MSEAHERLAEIFGELCDKDSAEQLAALTKLAEQTPQLARELAELLEVDAGAIIDPLLARIAGKRAPTSSPEPAREPRPAPAIVDALPKHPRYQILRKIGEGGLGVVYEAHDQERNQRVALKTFKHPGSNSIFRLKKEFRSLVGIDHPNLVTLYDLVVDEHQVFFTMELIDGQDALHFVRPDRGGSDGAGCDEARLRLLLPQLASGLAALHRAGKLHRDIKPSNVRVTPQGRAVLLDFGLAVDIEELENESLADAIVGTIAYMSPEQACAERNLGPATDWYAFGVLLYEALTGAHPFSGRPVELLAKKAQRVAPPPRQLVPDVARDLDVLCQGLLERSPERRTRGAAVLEALGVTADAPTAASSDSSTGQEQPILGREAQITCLLATFQLVQDTREARAVVVSGPSGIGKSSVVAEFLKRLRRGHGDVVILRGRCYERETVSHRAMDEVIDGLSRYWRNLPELDAGVLCPQEPHLLSLLFPVLGRVAAVAQRRRHEAPSDPQDCRTRSYAALRETFRKLATDRPVVIFVDDMQWADTESGSLLADLFVPPHMPAVMLVFGTRETELEGESSFSALLRALGQAVSTIELAPLASEESRALVAHILGAQADAASARIVEEAGGNAFFLTELCRAALAPAFASQQELTVETLVRGRVDALSETERKLLEIVAVAGQPVAIEIVETAAALTAAVCSDGLRMLRATHLLRSSSARRDSSVECYHSRVRDAVVAGLADAQQAHWHLALAEALELSKNASAQRLAHHWLAAGHQKKTRYWALRAADEARHSMDFSQAADLLAMAIDQGDASADEHRRLVLQWGDTLVEAGRALEAAAAFAQAMDTAPPSEELEMRLRMVQQLLAVGEIEKGLDAALALTRSVGWSLPRSPLATLARIVANNIALRWMGDHPKPVTNSKNVNRRRRRVEIASELARSLSLSDSLRGVVCSQQAIRDGLRLDDRERRARLLVMRSMAFCTAGKARRATHFIGEIEAVATASESPASLSYLAFARGYYDVSISHQWGRAVGHFDEAMQHWREAGRGEGWDLDSIKMISLTARALHGDLRAINHSLPQTTLQYARAGRRFLEVMLRTKHAVHYVLADRPEHAIAEVEDALALWPDKADSYLLQHFFGLFSTAQAELYMDRPDRAALRLDADDRLLRRSQLLRVVAFRIEYEFLHARTQLALAAKAQTSERSQHRRRALRHIAILDKIALPMAVHYASSSRVAVARLDEDEQAALEHLRAASEGFDTVEARLFAACARRQLGRMLGGDTGDDMVAAADLWMAREDVAHPQRTSALFIPGA